MTIEELYDLDYKSFIYDVRVNSFKYLIIDWFYHKMLDDDKKYSRDRLTRKEKFKSNRYLAWSLWNAIINYKILDPQLDIRDLYVNGDKQVQKDIWNIIYNSYYYMYNQLDNDIITKYYETTLPDLCLKLTSITVSLIKQFDIGNDTSIGSYDYEDNIPEIIDFTYVYFEIE